MHKDREISHLRPFCPFEGVVIRVVYVPIIRGSPNSLRSEERIKHLMSVDKADGIRRIFANTPPHTNLMENIFPTGGFSGKYLPFLIPSVLLVEKNILCPVRARIPSRRLPRAAWRPAQK